LFAEFHRAFTEHLQSDKAEEHTSLGRACQDMKMGLAVLVTMNSSVSSDEHLHHTVDNAYLDMLSSAGLIPLLAYATMPADQLAELLVLVEAVYLPGGDYHPEHVNESSEHSAKRAAELGMVWDPHKVALDQLVLRAAWQRFLPTLAICGGFQSMAVLDGGSLRSVTATEAPLHCQQAKAEKLTTTAPLIRQVLGQRVQTNSYHHQLIAQPGIELMVGATTSDGVIEAIEAAAAQHPFWLGLQWHPERLNDQRPFTALAQAARLRDQGGYDELLLAGKPRFDWSQAKSSRSKT
jgi:putative glutamine amidotransferase